MFDLVAHHSASHLGLGLLSDPHKHKLQRTLTNKPSVQLSETETKEIKLEHILYLNSPLLPTGCKINFDTPSYNLNGLRLVEFY